MDDPTPGSPGWDYCKHALCYHLPGHSLFLLFRRLRVQGFSHQTRVETANLLKNLERNLFLADFSWAIFTGTPSQKVQAPAVSAGSSQSRLLSASVQSGCQMPNRIDRLF